MQPHANIDLDTHENMPFLPTRPTVTVQHEDMGPWTHVSIVWHVSDYHHSRSYKRQVTNMDTSSPGPKDTSRPPKSWWRSTLGRIH